MWSVKSFQLRFNKSLPPACKFNHDFNIEKRNTLSIESIIFTVLSKLQDHLKDTYPCIEHFIFKSTVELFGIGLWKIKTNSFSNMAIYDESNCSCPRSRILRNNNLTLHLEMWTQPFRWRLQLYSSVLSS